MQPLSSLSRRKLLLVFALVASAAAAAAARGKPRCGHAVPVLIESVGSTEGAYPFCQVRIERSTVAHAWGEDGDQGDWYTVAVAAADGRTGTEIHAGDRLDVRIVPTLRDGEAFLYARTVLGEGSPAPLTWLAVFRYTGGLLEEVGMLPLSGLSVNPDGGLSSWSMEWVVGDLDGDGIAEVKTWFVAGSGAPEASAGVYRWNARKEQFLARDKQPAGRPLARADAE